jgi:hypothetical protein
MSVSITGVQGEHTGTTLRIRTTYDLATVREHAFELPVYNHPSHLYIVPLLVALMAVAIWLAPYVFQVGVLRLRADVQNIVSFYLKWGTPIIILVSSLAFLIAYLVSVELVKDTLMRQAVDKERGDGNWEVVEKRKWKRFCRNLEKPDPGRW